MALTEAERKRLQELRAEKQRREAAREADEHQRRYEEAGGRGRYSPEPFSLDRTLENIGRNTVRDMGNLAYDINRTALFRVLSAPRNFVEDVFTGRELGETQKRNLSMERPDIAQAEGTENAGGLESAITGVGGWLVPFTGALKGLKSVGFLAKASRTSRVARWAQPAAAGFLADFAQGNQIENNMANFLKDTFGLDNAAIDLLVSEEDDDVMLKRLKSAASGGVAGVATDALLKLGAKTIQGLKMWRGSRNEALATVANYDAGPIKLQREPFRSVKEADEAADEVAVPADAKSQTDKSEWKLQPDDGRTIESFDDVVQYIRDKAGDTEMSDEAFADFAENLTRGEPENLMARFGINAANLDPEVFADPVRLAQMQDGLSKAFEYVAVRLGRAGQEVSLQETMRAAEGLATSPQTLLRLHRSTEGLASKLTAGRMIVGGHAHVLLESAEKALKEIETLGKRGPEWEIFMRRFWEHGLILGTVAGAKSEIGRALQSLKKGVSWGVNSAKKMMQKGLDEEAVEQSPHRLDRMSFEDAAEEYGSRITTTAEAVEALQNTIRLGGDAGELSRVVRMGDEGILSKLDKVGAETVANLFTLKTAAVNITAGLSVVAVDGLSKALAALVRSPAFLIGNEKMKHEATRAALEAWAYTEKAVGWREAARNALAVARREANSELALTADAMGLENVAARAQQRAGEAEKIISGNFERGDVVGTKALAIPASVRKKLDKWVDEEFTGDAHENVDRFMRMGLKSLIRTMAISVNAAGTATRTGTTAFIHVPDQFAGTIAQKAEGYSMATRIASEEAWEGGLRGKEAVEFIKARAEDLYAGGPSEWGRLVDNDDAYGRVASHAKNEAKNKLMQTKPETKAGQWFANAGYAFGTWLVPFVNTLVRITERTVIDYSPVGLMMDSTRKAIAKGGAARDEALGRMFLGVTAIGMGYQLSETIVGADGGYEKTARDAGIASYSIKLGGDTYEFSSLEPLGSLIGIGADFREYMEMVSNDPDRYDEDTMTTFAYATATAVSANILSKNWLQTVQKLSEALGSEPMQQDGKLTAFLNTFASRVVPGAGVQKAVYNWQDGTLREAHTFREKVLSNTAFAGRLPEKKDSLGRTLERDGLDRFLGLPVQRMATKNTDLIMSELGALNMRDFVPDKKQDGVTLDAAQFSRFKELRGMEVRDKSGMTMVEKLEAMFSDPAYQALNDHQRAAAVRKSKRDYNKLARNALIQEDRNYAREQLRKRVFEMAQERGMTPQQRGLMLEVVEARFNAARPN